MKNIKYIALLLIFLISAISYGQNTECGGNPCPQGFSCDLVHGSYVCVRPGGGPPPPGLVVPIDSNIIYLLSAGFGLGIYFLISERKKTLN